MKILSLTRHSLIALLALGAGQAFAAPSVLLLQAQEPCGDSSIQDILNSWGIEYRVSETVPTATRLENYSTIIVPSNQPTPFYENLSARMPRITKWLKNGARTLEFHAASTCVEVAYTLTLPRGVIPTLGFAQHLHVRLPHSPLVAGVPADIGPYPYDLEDHVFANPVGKSVMVDPEGRTALIDYCVGDTGRVIAIGSRVENFYSGGSDGAPLLPNMLNASVYTPGCATPPAY